MKTRLKPSIGISPDRVTCHPVRSVFTFDEQTWRSINRLRKNLSIISGQGHEPWLSVEHKSVCLHLKRGKWLWKKEEIADVLDDADLQLITNLQSRLPAFVTRSGKSCQCYRPDVEIASATHLVLQCKLCGHLWSPDSSDGKMPNCYWKCPNGCNE